MYEVTGKFKNGEVMPRKIVNASSKREAMLQVMRDLGAKMGRLIEIDAEPV